MAEMRLSVKHTGDGHHITCENEAGGKMAFDGGDGAWAPTPMQHLLAAAGACALMDVEVILRKKRLAFRDLRVECVGQREKRGEVNPFTSMRLVFRVEGDVPAKAFEDAVRLSVEKYCSVGATIEKGVPIAHEAHVGA
jgi:putative redox protein